MTGDSPVLDRPALWAALSHMQIQLPDGAGRFEKVLAERQGWTIGFAERVAGEYRRFLYLAATAGFEVTPSRAVDEAWHLHLASPHYEGELCRRILGRPLDHRPARGEPGEQERHHRQYEATLALYERAFLKPPPPDIWPSPNPWREGRAEVGRKRRTALAIAAGTWFAAIPAYILGYPMAALFLAAVAIILIVALLANRLLPGKARSGNGAGCGGGCASATRGSDDPGGGESSCGGGGCGGD